MRSHHLGRSVRAQGRYAPARLSQAQPGPLSRQTELWRAWGGPPHLAGSRQQVQLDVGVCQPVVVHRLQALRGGGWQKV